MRFQITSWNPTGFYRVTWFHKIHEFTGLHKTQKDFMKFIRISLKSTEFHRISLNPIGLHKFSWNPTQVHVKSINFIMDFMIYFNKPNRISYNIMKSNTFSLKAIGFHGTQNSKYFMKSNRILLKATQFHRISWNQQDLKQIC